MLDDRDRRIMALLQEDADLPVADIADRVCLSPSACSRRIARLREEGYVLRRIALLDRRRMNLPTTVYALLRTSRHAAEWLDAFRAALSNIPEVVEAHRLTGSYDYILKIVLPDVEHYDQVYKRLVSRVELFDVSAYISMETLKQDTAIPTGFAR